MPSQAFAFGICATRWRKACSYFNLIEGKISMNTKHLTLLAWHVRALFHPEPPQGTGKGLGLLRAVVLGLILALGVLPVPNVSAAAASPFQSHPVEQLLNADGTLNLNTGWSGALDPRGWQVTLDAERGPLFEPAGSSPAKPAANTWMALGTGADSGAGAIAVSGSDVYVAGDFTSAAGVAANYIAKWDGSAWSALGTGTNSEVWAIAASGSDVYVGGPFTSAGGVAANNIAKWDGSAWSALGTGTNNIVCAIAISGSDVYVGGHFTSAGGVAANRIARWDGSAWSALGTGTDEVVYTIAASGSDVYAGGNFTSAGGVAANYIAKWNGSAWSALGTGANGFVGVIAVSGGNVYVSGDFTGAGTCASGCNYIARWDGSAWSALGTGTNGSVGAIAVSGSDVYVGGWFTSAGTCASANGCNYIAKWDGSAWSALGTGTNDRVYDIAVSGGDVYVGGDFTSAGGVANTAHIARYGPQSTNADLSSLALSSGTLAPPFASATTTYTASVANGVTSITVTPTASNTYATITVNGTPVASGSASGAIALNVGANTITTVVTAQDGTTTKTYTVTVTRAATADLSSLVLSSGTLTPPFASGTTTYTATVASCATSITVKPTAADASATITVNGTPVASGHASGAIALNFGANTLTTVVTAQDGTTTKTYTITVTRAAEIACSQDGGTWTRVNSPVTNSDWRLNSVTMVSSSDGWTVGDKGAAPNGYPYGPFILHWNGNTWSQVSISGAGSYGLDSVAMVSANDGWAVGGWGGPGRCCGNSSGAVLRWDGNTWSWWGAAGAHLASLAILSTTDVWAVGGYRYSYDSASATYHWNGTTLNGQFDHHWYSLYSVAMVSPNDGWAVGMLGEIKHWDGNTWTSLSSPVSSTLNSVAMVSANDGWAVGYGGILHWNGNNWSQASSPVTYTLNSVTMVSSNDGWAVGDSGTILHWNGNTWNQVSSPVTQTLKSVTMISADEGWAVGGSGVILHYTNFKNLADLSNLVLSSGTLNPPFASGTTTYTANVTNSVTSITATPTVSDTNATITVNGTAVASGNASGAINLNVGANTINVVVTAQDGTTTKTYTITVTRDAIKLYLPLVIRDE